MPPLYFENWDEFVRQNWEQLFPHLIASLVAKFGHGLDTAEREDIVHETFLKVYNKLKKEANSRIDEPLSSSSTDVLDDNIRTPKSYFWTVAHNQAVDYLRRKNREIYVENEKLVDKMNRFAVETQKETENYQSVLSQFRLSDNHDNNRHILYEFFVPSDKKTPEEREQSNEMAAKLKAIYRLVNNNRATGVVFSFLIAWLLSHITARQKQAVLFYDQYFGGLPLANVAQEMGVSQPTALEHYQNGKRNASNHLLKCLRLGLPQSYDWKTLCDTSFDPKAWQRLIQKLNVTNTTAAWGHAKAKPPLFELWLLIDDEALRRQFFDFVHGNSKAEIGKMQAKQFAELLTKITNFLNDNDLWTLLKI